MTPALINEIITLKSVSRLSPADIARRCGIDIGDVADVLIDAGLLMMKPSRQPTSGHTEVPARRWRNSQEAGFERWERRLDAPTCEAENPHLDHCLRVIRANGGRGFPYCQERTGAGVRSGA